MIEAINIGHCLPDGTWLWRGLNLAVGYRQITGLIGRNGSGKTTLVRTLAGLIDPHEGRVSAGATIGYVPQRSLITFPFTVRDVVAMGRVQHIKMFFSMTSFDQLAVDEAMDRVGVSHFAQRPYLDLSGGEKQLVLIARAIATGCSLLLLDEPLAGLDMDNQCRILSLLRELASNPGLGVLFSSHEPDHLFAVADSSLILKREETALLGPCAETLNAGELTHVYGIEIRVVEIPREYITTRHAVANFNT